MTEEIYVLSRGNAEAERLNRQHIWLKEFDAGDILHKSIPVQRFKNTQRPLVVADIGTGTGIWLLEFVRQIDTADQAGSEFTGFDISTSLINPDVQNSNLQNKHHIEFVVHDMLQPFPGKYHARFDIVHVRLLVCAVARSAISKALHNLRDILKPGGYLAWREADFADFTAQPLHHPTARATYQRIAQIVNAYGGSTTLPSDILATIVRESPPVLSSLTDTSGGSGKGSDSEGPRPPSSSPSSTNTNDSLDHLRLVAFERSTSSVFDDSSRQTGHAICCQVWGNAIKKAMEKLQKEADDDLSDTAEGRGRQEELRRKITQDQQLGEKLDRAMHDGSFEWRLAFTWIIAQKVSPFPKEDIGVV